MAVFHDVTCSRLDPFPSQHHGVDTDLVNEERAWDTRGIGRFDGHAIVLDLAGTEHETGILVLEEGLGHDAHPGRTGRRSGRHFKVQGDDIRVGIIDERNQFERLENAVLVVIDIDPVVVVVDAEGPLRFHGKVIFVIGLQDDGQFREEDIPSIRSGRVRDGGYGHFLDPLGCGLAASRRAVGEIETSTATLGGELDGGVENGLCRIAVGGYTHFIIGAWGESLDRVRR